MKRRDLQKLYDDGELDDPTELQRLRDEINTYTGLHVPRSVSQIEDWWADNKAVFARRIKDSSDMTIMEPHIEDDGEETNDEDNEEDDTE